jgi:hypothetical protein
MFGSALLVPVWSLIEHTMSIASLSCLSLNAGAHIVCNLCFVVCQTRLCMAQS